MRWLLDLAGESDVGAFHRNAERNTASKAAPRNSAISGSSSAKPRARPRREDRRLFMEGHLNVPARR